MLQEVGETLIELKRVHKLNMELLEQLNVACNYLLSNNVHVPNESTFASLLKKAWALMDEIRADEVRGIQYTVNRRKVTDFKTDEEVPAPFPPLYKGAIDCSKR
jgi:hypothetical protein